MLYIPILQPLVDWLTGVIVHFAQWLNSLQLPFGLDPIWLFCAILVFGGALFPVVVGFVVVALREQGRSLLLSQLQSGLGWCRTPVYGLRQTNDILYSLNVMDGSNLKNLINAFLLRMVYDGRLKPVVDTKGEVGDVQALAIGSGDKNSSLTHPDDKAVEDILFKMLKAAAGSDRVFQPRELNDYMKSHKQEMRTFVQILRKRMSKADIKADRENVRNVLGFKKFLEDFTISNERHAYEVQLWKDYLVYAILFGCGEQVRKDMREMNPDFAVLDARVGNINFNFEFAETGRDAENIALSVKFFGLGNLFDWLVYDAFRKKK